MGGDYFYFFNLFIAMMSLEKVRNSKPFSLFVFFFASACERIFIKTHTIESRCDTEPGNRLFAGCPCTFSPDILQAGTVKGLNPWIMNKILNAVNDCPVQSDPVTY